MLKMLFGAATVARLHLTTAFHAQMRILEEEFIAKSTGELHSEIGDPSFVLLVGFTKVGKSTYARSYAGTHATVSTDEMHSRLNAVFPHLQDDTTVSGSAYWQRQMLTLILRRRVIERLTEAQRNILIDACNLRLRQRKHFLQIAKRAGYKTTIVWVLCDTDTHQERLTVADAERLRKRLPATYGRLHAQQARMFQEPILDMVDRFITYTSRGVA